MSVDTNTQALAVGVSYTKKSSVVIIDWAFLVWSLQGMILRLPDYESGALTN